MGYPFGYEEENEAYVRAMDGRYCPSCEMSDCGWWLNGLPCLNHKPGSICSHDGEEFLSPIVNGPHAGAWLCADCCGHKRWASKRDVG